MKNVLKYIVLLLVFTLYALTLRGSLGNPTIKQIDTTLKEYSQPFESSHERSPYAVIMALDRDKSFSLSQDLADIGAPDVSYYNGKFYSFFPVGLPLLLYPFYELGKITLGTQLVTYATIALYAFISVVLVFLISKNIFILKDHFALFAALMFGFATTSWSYALTIYQHLPTTMGLLLMFYSAWKFKDAGKGSWLWASIIWTTYGILITLDYPNAILGLPIMVFLLINSFSLAKRTNKSSTPISISLAIVYSSVFFFFIVGGLLYFNYHQFGSPTRISQSFDRYERDKYELLLKKIQTRTERKGVAIVTKKTDSTLDETRIVQGSFTLLFDNDKGIFFYSPVLLLALLGFWSLLKKRSTREGFVLLFMTIINLFIYASFGDPWGGWAYGPRYLIPSMAFLSIAAGYYLNSIRSKVMYYLSAVITLFLFAYSSGVALLGALTTNIIPPKVEAIPLKLKYFNYFQNFEYLANGNTSNFVFNQYLRMYISLSQYFVMIWSVLLAFALILLIIIPLFEKHHESDI